jgi:hypothetical protein
LRWIVNITVIFCKEARVCPVFSVFRIHKVSAGIGINTATSPSKVKIWTGKNV